MGEEIAAPGGRKVFRGQLWHSTEHEAGDAGGTGAGLIVKAADRFPAPLFFSGAGGHAQDAVHRPVRRIVFAEAAVVVAGDPGVPMLLRGGFPRVIGGQLVEAVEDPAVLIAVDGVFGLHAL